MPSVQRSMVIEAPVSYVMKVVTDFKSYPSFIPAVNEVRILHSESNAWEVAFSIQVIRPFQFTLRLVRTGATSLSWSLLEGDFQVNDGAWHLEPLSSNQTRAKYDLTLRLGMFVPGNIFVSLKTHALDALMNCFTGEAERRFSLE